MGKRGKGGFGFGAGSMPGSTSMILKQAAKMQEKMAKNKERFDKLLFTGEAGGVLKIVIRGDNVVTDVKLNETAFQDMDCEDVEDLIKTAVGDALKKIQDAENDAERALMAGAAEDMSKTMTKEQLQDVANIVEGKDEE